MRIVELPRSATPDGPPLRIAVIGSCRVQDPFEDLVRRGTLAKVWANAGAGTYGLREAEQLIQYTLSNRDIPEALHPFIFPTPSEVPVRHVMQRRVVESVDIFIVEVSGLDQYRFRDFFFNAVCFVKEFVSKYGAPILPWYQQFSRREEISEELVETVLSQLALDDMDERDLVASILREARLEEMTPETATADMGRLAEGLKAEWIFVSHFLVPGLPGALMDNRRQIADCLQRSAAARGDKFFDPSEIVAKRGRAEALAEGGEDIYHYDAKFQIEVGDALLSLAAGRKEGSGPGSTSRTIYSAHKESIEAPRAASAGKELNDRLIALHGKRVAKRGVDESGLYAHYKHFLDLGEIVGAKEIDTVNLVARVLPPFRRYHVVQSGLGEIAFLLAYMGYETTAFELEARRFGAIVAGANQLNEASPFPATRLRLERGGILDVVNGTDTLCIATQAALGSHYAEGAILTKLERYAAILFEPRILIGMRETIDEQEALVSEIRARGFNWIRDYRISNEEIVFCAKRNPYVR